MESDVFIYMGSEEITDGGVQIRSNVGAGDGLHLIHAFIRAAGGAGEDIHGQGHTGGLKEMQDGPGTDQMMREADGLRHADILRTGDAVMAQDDVTKLTGNGSPDDLEGEPHIIDDNIADTVQAGHVKVEGGGVLVAEDGDEV